MFRYFFLILLTTLFKRSSEAQVTANFQVMASASLSIGTQEQLLNIGLNGGSVIQGSGVATELSASIALEVFTMKYGAKSKNKALKLEVYSLIGPDKERNNRPFYSGELMMQARSLDPSLNNIVYGAGFGVVKTIIGGELKPLANQQGVLLVRANVADRPLIVRIQNDFRALLFIGGGTDQGETGGFHVGYSVKDSHDLLHTFGFNVAIFTPVPDYSKNPTHTMNSDDESRPVLMVREPFTDLYFGNFFLSYSVLSKSFSQYVGLGIESHKLGGKIQNSLHDGFGLYPRFPWDMTQKNKLFVQSITSMGYDVEK